MGAAGRASAVAQSRVRRSQPLDELHVRPPWRPFLAALPDGHLPGADGHCIAMYAGAGQHGEWHHLYGCARAHHWRPSEPLVRTRRGPPRRRHRHP
eukprot:3356099-Pyramimonas_sp.AAC.2